MKGIISPDVHYEPRFERSNSEKLGEEMDWDRAVLLMFSNTVNVRYAPDTSHSNARIEPNVNGCL
jgi:hypothetical protein